jgi:predicted RNase H-like nuclease (RuvC/YqgF family)
MGNKKEVFKLLTMVLGAVCSREGAKAVVERGVSALTEEQAEVMRIMIENALGMGQESAASSRGLWRWSEQKRVFARMEALEDRIEDLETENRSLEERLGEEKEVSESSRAEVGKLKEEIKRLMGVNGELVDLNDKAVNEAKLANL